MNRVLRRGLIVVSAGLALACLTTTLWLRQVQLPESLQAPPASGTRFTDRNGVILRETLLDGARFTAPVSIDRLPPTVLAATVCAEDKRFWSHKGIDPFAIARATFRGIEHGRFFSGASTISQQLIKIAQPRPRTFSTKLIEAAQALRLEQTWSKRQILEAYLGRIDYGNSRIGIAAAAEYYFGKPPNDLSLAEAAFLAGLPRSPSRLDPKRHLPRALQRQKWILDRMEKNHLITAAECARAQREPIQFAFRAPNFDAPHFVDLVRQERPLSGGHEVRTTLDLEINRFCRRSLQHHLVRLRDQEVSNGAVVVIENRTGNVIALVGSENYFAPAHGQVNGARAARSAGSALKPFTYLLALENGATPATLLADVPVAFPTSTGIYRPENYNHLCYGPVRLRVALANSLNIPAVKVLASLGGAVPLQKLLRRCGITTLEQSADRYGLGLTIGNANVRLLEMVNAYATLARLGEFQPYRLLESDPFPTPERIGSKGGCYLIADILSDDTARALTFGTNSWLRFDFPVAVKTGTSASFRDNWAIGYTPEFTAGVWVGNFDGRPMHQVSGVSGAAPILNEVFAQLHEKFGSSWYAKPAGIIDQPVHPITGRLVRAGMPGAVSEKFAAGALPEAESPDDYDAEGRIKLGAEYRQWLASGAPDSLGEFAGAVPANGHLSVVSPLPGSVYYLDPDLPQSDELPLKANATGPFTWQSPTLECASKGGQTVARLREGRHQISLRNPQTGAQAETWIVVKAL
jgi:penicillin-binding protein 1C